MASPVGWCSVNFVKWIGDAPNKGDSRVTESGCCEGKMLWKKILWALGRVKQWQQTCYEWHYRLDIVLVSLSWPLPVCILTASPHHSPPPFLFAEPVYHSVASKSFSPWFSLSFSNRVPGELLHSQVWQCGMQQCSPCSPHLGHADLPEEMSTARWHESCLLCSGHLPGPGILQGFNQCVWVGFWMKKWCKLMVPLV